MSRRDIAPPKYKCLLELFEAKVEAHPDNTAVIFEDSLFSYRELNIKANQLAHHLRTLGVGPETLVGLYANRSLEMAVGVMGILKAGGAYVPLDPAYPEERLRFMLEDARAELVLTESKLMGSPLREQAQMVCLDSPILSSYPTDNTRSLAGPDNLAYVIYTSGSTGRPKGVAMEHGALSNLIHWQINGYGFKPQARTLQFAPLSFDVSFQEMYSTWCSGGAVVLVSADIRRDAPAMLRLMSDQRVERLFLPFVALQHLAETAVDSNEFPRHLSEVITAGEQLRITPALVRFFTELRQCTLTNQYGPTETHVATAYTMRGMPHTWPALPPIGRAIANTETYIMDEHLKPVPAGVEGELYLGGDCLARGYLNRSELTEQRFVKGPKSLRMYRTGDLVRRRPDGEIEYLGRTDNQVKIRGFRIELGEIESVLLEIKCLRHAVVTAELELGGTQKLVAYVVASDHSVPDVNKIRTFLRARLPDYMIPSAIVLLERMPLTPSGKIDRRSLAGMTGTRLEGTSSRIGPRNADEEAIAGIFARVLGLDSVGVQDNFFDLGGHSLLAVRVRDEIEKTMHRRLPLTSIYLAPTVEHLARFQETPGESESLLVPLQPAGSNPPFFWIHGEASDPILARYLGPDRPVYGVMHQGHDGKPALFTTVEDIAAYYLGEIRKVQSHGPYLLGGYCFGGIVAFEMGQQLQKEGQAVPLLVLLDPDIPKNVHFPSLDAQSVAPNDRLTHRVRIRRKLENFRRLRSKEKFDYVLVGLKEKVRVVPFYKNVRRLAKTTAAKVCFRLGYNLPVYLRSLYIIGIYERALSRYVPKPYFARMIVLNTATNSDSRTWTALGRGGLDIYEVPGDHAGVLKEPSVKVWARRLKSLLQQTSTAAMIIASICSIEPVAERSTDILGTLCFVLDYALF